MRRLKNKILIWFRCVRKFGFYQGSKIFFQLFGSKGSIRSSKLPGELNFRPKNSEDIYTFQELFLAEQYQFDFPVEIKTIVDAGANIGYASVYLSAKYPNANIIALEPDAENFALLEKNTIGLKNVTCINKALWNDEMGIQIMNQESGNRGYMVEKSQSDQIIESTTVEALMSLYGWNTIDLFKIDIEGAEQEVFEHGADKWLNKTNAMFIELHDRMKPHSSKPVFKAVSNHDFLFDMKGENLVFYKTNKA